MTLSVLIVFSPHPREVVELQVTLEVGTTIAQALKSPELLAQPMPRGLNADGFGIWGKKVGSSHVLQDQDRLEIYRPLTVDPKVARRERFAKQGSKKAAGLFARRRTGAKAGY
jgi:putative ubiquitin-RnfH superfamily antitoxin RatB of RatAB toxin-antitoxin module